MNKRFDFTNLGGFPLTQDVLAFMQESYRDAIGALVSLCGDKTILTGVVVGGGSVSAGWIVYNGELLPFNAGAVGTQVVITETGSTLTFEDASTPTVKFNKVASCGSVGAFAFSELTRLDNMKVVQEALAALTTAYNAHTHAWSTITGRPPFSIVHADSYSVGDAPSTDGEYTITIPNQGGISYRIIGTMRGLSASTNLDNDVSWVVKIVDAETFKLGVREYGAVAQNLVFDYIIVKTT